MRFLHTRYAGFMLLNPAFVSYTLLMMMVEKRPGTVESLSPGSPPVPFLSKPAHAIAACLVCDNRLDIMLNMSYAALVLMIFEKAMN